MEYYYLGYVEIPSALTKMEVEISKALRDYEYTVIAESELDILVQDLQNKQTEISSENPRLKQVKIQWARIKYSGSNVGASIGIGRNYIQLIKINQFIGFKPEE